VLNNNSLISFTHPVFLLHTLCFFYTARTGIIRINIEYAYQSIQLAVQTIRYFNGFVFWGTRCIHTVLRIRGFIIVPCIQIPITAWCLKVSFFIHPVQYSVVSTCSSTAMANWLTVALLVCCICPLSLCNLAIDFRATEQTGRAREFSSKIPLVGCKDEGLYESLISL
jgi:hypothetical protein